MQLSFFIPGEACAQGRPRFTTFGGHVHAYDPEKSKNYKAFVKLIAKDEAEKQDWKYNELPLKIKVRALIEVPASKSKKFRAAALDGLEYPTKKPDVDNLFKTITDAMSGIIYKDDKQIIVADVSKRYSEQAGVEVLIEVLQ